MSVSDPRLEALIRVTKSHHESFHEFSIGPVIILAPPRSFTSVVCAMLGQHPNLCGLPELQLFTTNTVAEWWQVTAKASFGMRDGLHRAIAEFFFGGQSELHVDCARGWLRRRFHYTTGMIIEEIARRVHPRIIVEKSPSIVYRLEHLRRAFAMFPQARFLHLTRHPIAHGESVLKMMRARETYGPAPYWLLNLSSFPYWPRSRGPESILDIDPQRGWYALHHNILEFLKDVPASQQARVRGEDLLAEPERVVAQLASWLGLRSDPEAIESMRHPERSLFAAYGPPNAPQGNDPEFLSRPHLRPERALLKPLESTLSWRTDGRKLSDRVVKMAHEFGYR
jgi:hypothetical protein